MYEKILALIISVAVATGCTPPGNVFAQTTVVDNAYLESQQLTDGRYIAVECEDMNIINTQIISVQENTAASGGKFLRSTAAKANTSTPKNPDIQYTFRFEKPAVYNLWISVGVTGSASNDAAAFYYSLNGGSSYSRSTVYLEGKNFKWVKLTTRHIPEGNLNFCIGYRNKNISYDKIILTTDNGFTPDDKDDVPNGDTTGWYPLPTINPPAGHPRLYVTPDSLERFKRNVSQPELSTYLTETYIRAGEYYINEDKCYRTKAYNDSDAHSMTSHVADGLRGRALA